MQAPSQKEFLFPIFLTFFIDSFGLAIIYPIFTPLFLEIGHSLLPSYFSSLDRTFVLSAVIAAFPFAQLFGAPLIGQFSDLYGRKKSLLIAITGETIGYFFTGVSLIAGSFWLLFFSRLWTGFFSGNLTVCLAAIADVSPDQKTRTRHFGFITTLAGLSFLIAVILGRLFFQPTSEESLYRSSFPFWLVGALTLFNLFFVSRLFQESHLPAAGAEKKRFTIFNLLPNPKFRTIYLIYFLFMISWMGTIHFLPAIFRQTFQLSATKITLLFLGIGILWSLSSLLVNRFLSNYFSPVKILSLSLFLLGYLTLLASASYQTRTFLILILICTMCASLSWTNSLVILSFNTSSNTQGKILGLSQSIISITAALGAAIGGLLVDVRFHLVYFFSSLCALGAFSILWKHREIASE